MDPIDLRSDTVTTPSPAMREAAADAEVGDDVYREDPTVRRLQHRVADRLGTETALYFPSGTMANQAAIRVHTDRGQEVICDELSHAYRWEVSGLAQHAAVQARPVRGGKRGTPGPETITETYLEPGSHHAPGTGLLVLENTHNTRGGLAIKPGRIDAAAETAADLGVPTHLDGARLWNAAVARDVTPARFVESVDTVMVALSKGLGAPIGSVLAGPTEFIEQARDVRKLLGGGMRQVGIIAAPGLTAIETIDRLDADHANAQTLADGLTPIDGLGVDDPETNIVLADTSGLGLSATEFNDRLADAGVLATEMGEHTARLVTHRDVDSDDIETALSRINTAIESVK